MNKGVSNGWGFCGTHTRLVKYMVCTMKMVLQNTVPELRRRVWDCGDNFNFPKVSSKPSMLQGVRVAHQATRLKLKISRHSCGLGVCRGGTCRLNCIYLFSFIGHKLLLVSNI